MSGGGRREQKSRDVRQRVTASALKLFTAQGYDAVTVDAIATDAGIARRTFFTYFRSKDDVLLEWQLHAWNAILEHVLAVSPRSEPLPAVRTIFLEHALAFQSEQMRAIDAVMLASETLTSRKPGLYAAQEDSLYAAMCEVWREPERRAELRAVAMLSIGALRLGLEAWRRGDPALAPTRALEQVYADIAAVSR